MRTLKEMLFSRNILVEKLVLEGEVMIDGLKDADTGRVPMRCCVVAAVPSATNLGLPPLNQFRRPAGIEGQRREVSLQQTDFKQRYLPTLEKEKMTDLKIIVIKEADDKLETCAHFICGR